jgi:hypothetical protein
MQGLVPHVVEEGCSNLLSMMWLAMFKDTFEDQIPEIVPAKLTSLAQNLVNKRYHIPIGACGDVDNVMLDKPQDNAATISVTRNPDGNTVKLLGDEAGCAYGHLLNDLLDDIIGVRRRHCFNNVPIKLGDDICNVAWTGNVECKLHNPTA